MCELEIYLLGKSGPSWVKNKRIMNVLVYCSEQMGEVGYGNILLQGRWGANGVKPCVSLKSTGRVGWGKLD